VKQQKSYSWDLEIIERYRYLVWRIKNKTAELPMMTIIYCSICSLFLPQLSGATRVSPVISDVKKFAVNPFKAIYVSMVTFTHCILVFCCMFFPSAGWMMTGYLFYDCFFLSWLEQPSDQIVKEGGHAVLTCR
jgi:hypothetical protein